MYSGLFRGSGAPCPMCMSAIQWARIDAVYFACDLVDTRKIGFDDAFQCEDFALPLDQGPIKIMQFPQNMDLKAYEVWFNKKDRHFY